MTVREKRCAFTKFLARLIDHAQALGYEIAIDEAYRPKETAELYARQKRGIRNSLHTLGLAVDVNLYRDGQYCTDAQDYAALGTWWELQHELATWGGRFNDARHFSFTHEGRK